VSLQELQELDGVHWVWNDGRKRAPFSLKE